MIGSSQLNMVHQTLQMKKQVRDLKTTHKRPAGALQFGIKSPTASWSGDVTVGTSSDATDAKFRVEFVPDDSTKLPISDCGLNISTADYGQKFVDDRETCSIFGLPPNGNRPRWQINFTHNDYTGAYPDLKQRIDNLTVAVFSQVPGTVTIARIA